VRGPGAELFKEVEKELGDLPIIAEALEPAIKKEANALLNELGYPGIRGSPAWFSGGTRNPHLPETIRMSVWPIPELMMTIPS